MTFPVKNPADAIPADFWYNKTMLKDNNKIQLYFFLTLFAVFAWLMLMLLKPFLSVITLAAIFAIVLYPLYKRALKLLKNKKGLASFTVTSAAFLFVLIPVIILSRQVFLEAVDVYKYVTTVSETKGFLQQIPQALESFFNTNLPNFNFQPDAYVDSLFNWLIGNLGQIFSSTFELIVGVFLILISLYFFLKDGSTLKEWLIYLSPLDDKYDKEIAKRMQAAVYAVFVGSLLIALVQGILVGLGLAIFGVPNYILWAFVAALSALLPGIGTGLVAIPAVLYLYFSGDVFQAVGLTVWSIALVGLIDNVLVPVFYGRGTEVHPLAILFTVLGGLIVFGPVGFLLGPIVLSIFLALIDIYQILVLGSAKGRMTKL